MMRRGRRGHGELRPPRCLVAQNAVRPLLVVVAPPRFDEDDGLSPDGKPLRRQAFVAEAAVKALVGAVLPGLARVAIGHLDAAGLQSPTQSLGDKLRTVVASQVLRQTMHCHQARAPQ